MPFSSCYDKGALKEDLWTIIHIVLSRGVLPEDGMDTLMGDCCNAGIRMIELVVQILKNH